MKSKKILFSILVGICSVLCSFGLLNKPSSKTVSAAQNVGCHTMILNKDADEPNNTTTYVANKLVGKASGDGKFTLNTEDVTLTAEAETDFQIVGWKIVLDEQNKTLFVSTDQLESGSKELTITLKSKENVEVDATISFSNSTIKSVYNKSTFKLDRVFENLTVTPVFDNIYYKLEIPQYSYFKFEAPETISDSTRLYFTNKTTVGDEIKYEQCVVVQDGKSYYYENLFSKDGEYYTYQNTWEDTAQKRKVEYSQGSFIVEENVKTRFNFDISSDLTTSKNVDVLGAFVEFGNKKYDLSAVDDVSTTAGYKIAKDNAWKRTESIDVNFTIQPTSTAKNILKLSYHDLYAISLKVKIDDVLTEDASQLSDLFDIVSQENNSIKGNISIENFFSKNENNTLFLVKKSVDNGYKSFVVRCESEVKKYIDYQWYTYYVFGSLDKMKALRRVYPEPSNNSEIEIEYSAKKVNVNFECLEYNAAAKRLNKFEGAPLSEFQLLRGESVQISEQNLIDAGVDNVGYRFLGYSLSDKVADVASANPEFTINIDKNKPANTKIYIIFQKIEYSISFKNINQLELNGTRPLIALGMNVQNLEEDIVSKTFESELENASEISKDVVNANIKLGGKLQISYVKNNGFMIAGFSVKNTFNVQDCFVDGKLELTTQFIQENRQLMEIEEAGQIKYELTIYVFEEIETYTITYVINPTKDDIKSGIEGEDVFAIMANISATTQTGSQAQVQLYTAAGPVEPGAPGEIVKIEISNLQYDEQVVLKCETKSGVDESSNTYYYMFNRFTADGVTDLSKQNVQTITSHEGRTVVTSAEHLENVKMSKEIVVVYSMPTTKLHVEVNEEARLSPNFKLDVTIVQNGETKELDEFNECMIDASAFTINVTEVFGFKLDKYVYNSSAEQEVLSYTIDIGSANSGLNNIMLIFKKIEYQFQFKQYGAGEEYISFGGNNFTTVTLDTDQAQQSTPDGKFVSLILAKPEGYFVNAITFSDLGSEYNSVAVESNALRNQTNKTIFVFKVSTEDFENIIINHSKLEGSVLKVLVNIYYSQYTYQISIDRMIRNSQGSKDGNVVLPEIKAFILGAIEKELIPETGTGESVLFSGVPYGAKVRVSVVSEPSRGMGKSGFEKVDHYVLDFNYDLDNLTINKTNFDVEFRYVIYYLPVNLVVEYNKNYGSVDVKVDNILLNEISLFQKLEIIERSNIGNGYVFKELSYEKINYVEYQHSEESWAELKATLYLKNNQDYVLNDDEQYDATKTYYIRRVDEVVISETDVTNEIVFEDANFLFNNYNIITSADGSLKLFFHVEFELLEMTIKNTIIENTTYGQLSEKGTNDKTKLKFNIEDFASFKITKTDKDDQKSDISNGGVITYNDVVDIEVTLNKKAINQIDGKEYDLSLGLTLNAIRIYVSPVGFNPGAPGVYRFSVAVSEHFERIFVENKEFVINYEFRVEKFDVETTTIVDKSAEFYENVILNIDALSYGFHEQSESSITMVGKDKVVLKQDLQYLASGMTYVSLSESYKSNFVIYGIDVYINGSKIGENEYEKYSIKPLTESTESIENCYEFKIFGDLRIEFLIRPKITFNNDGPQYQKPLQHDEKGYAKEQRLTCGVTSKFDLQVASFLADSIVLLYKKENDIFSYDSVKNAGIYNVEISFNISDGAEYQWLRNIKVENQVTLEILKKEIRLTYDKQKIEQTSKVYDGNSMYSIENVYQWLLFTDGQGFNVNYKDDVLTSTDSNYFSITPIQSYISTAGKDKAVKDADESKHYNFYLYDFMLYDNEFNNNFHLVNTDLIIEKFIQIKRAELKIQNLQVYSKVYDGTTDAQLVEGVKLGILGIIDGDKVSIDNLNNIKLTFEDKEVGTDKKVLVDATNAISGESAQNYYVASSNIKGLAIYPHKLTCKVEGRGDIELINTRGLTDHTLVDLIPIGAELKVHAFKKDSNPYVDIYSKIRSRVRGRNEFVVGYQLIMIYEGKQVPIDNNLYLSIPSIKDLTGAFYLYDNKTGEVSSTTEDKRLLIDLQPIDGNIEYVFLIHRRTLLKPWQIVLIVIGSVLVVAGGVLTFILIRKHKKSKDAVHEKI